MIFKRIGNVTPIIAGLIIFFASVYFAFSFGIFAKPQKTITAKFQKAGPLPEKMPVYYKGLKIGKVTKMELSEDYKYTLLTVEIYKKKFDPPKNIYAEIKVEGQAELRGRGVNLRKYMELVYPQNPSPDPLKDGDVIEGKVGDIEKIQELISESIDKEGLKSTANNMQQISENTEKITKNMSQITEKIDDFLAKNRGNIDEIVDNTKATSENVRCITMTVREFSEKPTEEKGLRYTLENTAEISENINKITIDIDRMTGSREFQDGVIKSSSGLKNVICKANITLDDADRAINRYDCLGVGLSEMLSERFLLLKLIFGKPGDAFQRCMEPCPPAPRYYRACPAARK